MASVSVLECIRGCWRSVRHINWQTGTAVSEVDTSNLLLQKRMPPPECASLISNLVLISSCCPLRRIWWQLQLEESFFPFFYPPPPPPAALSFQNKGREKHNLIPCGNVMQLENREGITATLYNIKKSDGLFWFSMLEKTHWCLTFISAVYPPYKAL